MRPTSLALHKIHFLSSLIPISTLAGGVLSASKAEVVGGIVHHTAVLRVARVSRIRRENKKTFPL